MYMYSQISQGDLTRVFVLRNEWHGEGGGGVETCVCRHSPISNQNREGTYVCGQDDRTG